MKIKSIITALFLLTGTGIYANINMTDSALIYYSNSEYEKALEIYLSFIDDELASDALYYNIGNCYYKLNKIPHAILWYERAKLLNPSNEDIYNNLKIANSRIKDKVEPLPKIFYVQWYNDILKLFNSNTWAWMSFGLFIFLLISLSLFLMSGSAGIKKIFFTISIIALIFSLLSLLFSVQQKNNQLYNNNAVVFEYSLVKSSPSRESTNLFEINEGLKVEVLETLNEWSNIKLEDGKQGWIPSENIIGI